MGTWFDEAPTEFSEWVKGRISPTESQATFNKLKDAWHNGYNKGKESINDEREPNIVRNCHR